MNKNTKQNIIAWISAVLGAISSLLLILILWKKPVQKLTTTTLDIPKIKLPEEDENILLQSTSLGKPQSALPQRPKSTTQADDLKKIEGIGPRISQLLIDHQVDTFTALSKMQTEDLRNILTEAKIRIADPSTWPEQAVYAEKKDWEGLKAFQDKLKGGRRAS